MDFQIFCMYVQNNILIWMPSSYEGFTPSLKWVDHLNRQYMGLVLTKDGEGISPAINLSAAYEQYQQGRPMDEIMKQIAQGMQVELPNVDISILDSYDSVKEHLIMRVNNADKNQIMLKEVPHAQIEDLAITYHIILGEDDEGIRCATITNELMDNLGVTVEQLHADAAEIYQKNDSAVLINMADRMRMAGIEMPDMGVYILSTQKGMFGAAAMFQPDVDRKSVV